MEWQPIETAPKDGTEIVGIDMGFGQHVYFCTWCDAYPKDDLDAGWFDEYECEVTPSHWMPKPRRTQPPTGEGEVK